MKILFYDIKEFELDYLFDKFSSSIEPYFFKTNLNNSTFIDDKFIDSEGICCFVSSQLDKQTLSKFKHLKFIFLRSVGFSNVDLEYCKEKNIKIFNAPNYGNSTVAEFAFAILLSLTKKVSKAQQMVKEGTINANEIMGVELYGKTFGVIGVGAIGRKMINIAHGFGMNVLAYDINPKGAYNFVEIDELLKKSDFVSINCPLNSSTQNLINNEKISLMKKEAFLINVARGEIVNTKDLYHALINKQIKGALLDVIECEEILCQTYNKCAKNENIKSHCIKKFFFIQKLLQLPNVIITPHNAYNTKEAQTRILDITLENIKSSFDITASTKNLILI